MLPIELFREDPEVIRESEKKRFKDPKIVDKVVELDEAWRAGIKKLQDLRAKKNNLSLRINELKKEGRGIKSEVSAVKKVSADIEKLEKQTDKLLEQRDEYRYRVGNILHESVPIAENETGNVIVRKWGKPRRESWMKAHADLVTDLDLADVEKASELAGTRFYYLKNEAVILNFAMLRLALDMMLKHKFTPFWTPYFLRKKYMAGAAELAEFEEQLYKIEGEDLFLIATSEQTLASLHAGEVLDEKTLPRTYTAYSACFRREAGAHGKDTKGIFRVHQFDKIEQYVFCLPKDSWAWHEKMIRISEEIFKALEIPHRIVNVASGEINDNGAKTYDLEAWFSSMGTYREVGSATNCTDYQARKLAIKYGKVGAEKAVLHTLNNTALATERAMCALLENHQQKDGSVNIPRALWKYTGFKAIKPKKVKKGQR